MSGAKKLETTWRQILPWRLQKIMIIMINSREVRERMNSSVRWSSGSPKSSELLYERLGIYIGRAVINKSTAMMACLSFLIEAVPRYPEHPDESPAPPQWPHGTYHALRLLSADPAPTSLTRGCFRMEKIWPCSSFSPLHFPCWLKDHIYSCLRRYPGRWHIYAVEVPWFVGKMPHHGFPIYNTSLRIFKPRRRAWVRVFIYCIMFQVLRTPSWSR